ncbi:MAG: hypothetical protein IH598_17690 [Bacteroidales bacterium]|nr:hypothetical protein [Bacteroidales bacterium]
MKDIIIRIRNFYSSDIVFLSDRNEYYHFALSIITIVITLLLDYSFINIIILIAFNIILYAINGGITILTLSFYLANGQFNKVERISIKAINRGLNHRYVNRALALAYVNQNKNLKVALDIFQETLKVKKFISPDSASDYGWVCMMNKEYEKAHKLLMDANKKNKSRNIPLKLRVGLSYFFLNDYTNAFNAIKKFIHKNRRVILSDYENALFNAVYKIIQGKPFELVKILRESNMTKSISSSFQDKIDNYALLFIMLSSTSLYFIFHIPIDRYLVSKISNLILFESDTLLKEYANFSIKYLVFGGILSFTIFSYLILLFFKLVDKISFTKIYFRKAFNSKLTSKIFSSFYKALNNLKIAIASILFLVLLIIPIQLFSLSNENYLEKKQIFESIVNHLDLITLLIISLSGIIYITYIFKYALKNPKSKKFISIVSTIFILELLLLGLVLNVFDFTFPYVWEYFLHLSMSLYVFIGEFNGLDGVKLQQLAIPVEGEAFRFLDMIRETVLLKLMSTFNLILYVYSAFLILSIIIMKGIKRTSSSIGLSVSVAIIDYIMTNNLNELQGINGILESIWNKELVTFLFIFVFVEYNPFRSRNKKVELNLQDINGVGPKVEQELNQLGIVSVYELAELNIDTYSVFIRHNLITSNITPSHLGKLVDSSKTLILNKSEVFNFD